MIQSNHLIDQPTSSLTCEVTCFVGDQLTLINALLTLNVAHFDVWQAQRYGVSSDALTLLEQAKGYRQVSYIRFQIAQQQQRYLADLLLVTPHLSCRFLTSVACDTQTLS